MGTEESLQIPSGGYGLGPPWLFRGRALYQLHLVKADVARPFVPKELKLVEAFGYTLGGLFLAQYDDSPAGAFDEVVVIAAIVWNPPTSCAWAARVLVNSHEACRHGRKEIGLPSHVAVFSKRDKQVAGKPLGRWQSFLDRSTSSWVRPVASAKISRAVTRDQADKREGRESDVNSLSSEDEALRCSISVLLSKPILALEFSQLKMQVEAPTIVTNRSLSRTTKTC